MGAQGIFVDRESARGVFERAVFDIPADSAIIRVFHGVGGQGKTALADELFRLSQGKTDRSFAFLNAAKIAPGKAPDPDLFLVQIRNAFARTGIPFPAFDLAFAIMWQKVRGELSFPVMENAWLHRVSDTANAVMPDAIKLTVKLIEEGAASVPGVGWLASAGTRWLVDRSKKAWLFQTRDCLKLLYRNNELVPDAELVALMPRILAQDLRAFVEDNRRRRLVLFVDEYERMFEGAGGAGEFARNESDEFLRRLVENAGGLLVVFFSRNRLPWEENPDWRARLSDCHTRLDGLPESCADEWLRKIPVPDEKLRGVMISNSREPMAEQKYVYPLLLQLQVEHWRNVSDGREDALSSFTISDESFEGRCRELVTRLLGDYPQPMQSALKLLAPATRFDRKLFEHACRHFNIPLSFDMFDRLGQLSILSNTGGEWLKMHRVVADVICETLDANWRERATAFLVSHFRERAGSSSTAETDDDAAVCLDEALRLQLRSSARGAADWLAEASSGIHRAGRHAVLERLWSDCLLACCATLGDMDRETALCLSRLGCSLDAQGRSSEAEPLHRDALRILFETRMETTIDAARTRSYLASCLYEFGTDDRLEEAAELQSEALVYYRSTLGKQAVETAAACANMASLDIRRRRLRDAAAAARKALEIRLAQLGEANLATVSSLSQLGLILDLLWLGSGDEALRAESLDLHRRAIRVLDEPRFRNHPQMGESREALAVHLNMKGLHAESDAEFRNAHSAFEAALGDHHPRTARCLINRGTNLYAARLYEEARDAYGTALSILTVALGPRHPLVGVARYNIGKVLTKAGSEKTKDAIAELEAARAVFAEAYRPGHFRRDACDAALAEAYAAS